MNKKTYQAFCSLKENVSSDQSTGLENFRFSHLALPEIDFAEISVETEFLGKKLAAPFLISSMTGGTKSLGATNSLLAQAASENQIAFAVGSQRVLLEAERKLKQAEKTKKNLKKAAEDFENVLASFISVKKAKPPLFFGNLGAVQLNNGFYFADVKRAKEIIHADGVFLHLNSLQEALQTEGNTNFSGLANKIEEIMTLADFPVIVKEVGFGLDEKTLKLLKKCGVKIVDVAGAGGTNWLKIEAVNRAVPEASIDFAHVADAFGDWGCPTAESINFARQIGGFSIIASGGVSSGQDAAKALALGADLVGVALPFFQAANQSFSALTRLIRTYILELKLAMFGVGAKNIAELKKIPLHEKNNFFIRNK